MIRYLEKHIISDLKDKMVFIWWPRQVWKTTFSEDIANKYYKNYTYLNWDNLEHKKRILGSLYNTDSEIIIFDEIHKYKSWKSFLKWEYDVKKDKYNFLVTWSARLDIYQKWWDSMLWRYYYYRLHPFSLAEILNIENDFSSEINLKFKDIYPQKELDDLCDFGWFPEIFSKKNNRILNRWRNDRLKRIVYEDVRDLNNIRDLWMLEFLASILHTKIWSPFSINSLVEDLKITNKTISNWVDILERVYYCYRIYPFNKSDLKSLKKEPKLYLWDYSWITDIWNRNENLIASHLIKWRDFLEDIYWYNVKIQYLRDKEQREVDFVIVINWEIKYLIEVKTSDTDISKSLIYFKEKLWVKDCFQIVFNSKELDLEKDWIRIISASKFLTAFV
jgi:predicted AAA+ superfamily ATPase